MRRFGTWRPDGADIAPSAPGLWLDAVPVPVAVVFWAVVALPVVGVDAPRVVVVVVVVVDAEAVLMDDVVVMLADDAFVVCFVGVSAWTDGELVVLLPDEPRVFPVSDVSDLLLESGKIGKR